MLNMLTKIRYYLILIVVWVILFISLGSLLIVYSQNVTATDLLLAFLPQHAVPNSPYILVIGVDEAETTHRADTIMVFKVHNDTKKINMISIPRDSYVYIPRYGYDKLGHAYAYGGADLLQLTVENLMNINIHRRVNLSIEDMKEIINLIGGVDLDVERRMRYVDRAGGINIDLQPGFQHLNADQALDYIRFRKTADGDIGRIKRQQKLVQALVREVTKPYNLLKIPDIMILMKNRLDTDLELKEMVWLGGKIKKAYDHAQLFRATTPGQELIINEISYLGLDKHRLAYILERAADPTEVGGATQAVSSTRPRRPTRVTADIAVLNGNGIPGAATWGTEKLQNKGFKVIYAANANYFNYEKSLLLARQTNKQKAYDVAAYWGLTRERVQLEEIDERVDVVLILGHDYQEILK